MIRTPSPPIIRNDPPCVGICCHRHAASPCFEQLVEAVRVVEPQMLVVDGVPLAAIHDRREIMVLGDQHTVIGEQHVDAAHHVTDVLDVREHVARGDHLRRPCSATDALGRALAEELPVAGPAIRRPARSAQHRPSAVRELAQQRPVVRADVDDQIVRAERTRTPRREVLEVLMQRPRVPRRVRVRGGNTTSGSTITDSCTSVQSRSGEVRAGGGLSVACGCRRGPSRTSAGCSRGTGPVRAGWPSQSPHSVTVRALMPPPQTRARDTTRACIARPSVSGIFGS
jgi:hypothetical protein